MLRSLVGSEMCIRDSSSDPGSTRRRSRLSSEPARIPEDGQDPEGPSSPEHGPEFGPRSINKGPVSTENPSLSLGKIQLDSMIPHNCHICGTSDAHLVRLPSPLPGLRLRLCETATLAVVRLHHHSTCTLSLKTHTRSMINTVCRLLATLSTYVRTTY